MGGKQRNLRLEEGFTKLRNTSNNFLKSFEPLFGPNDFVAAYFWECVQCLATVRYILQQIADTHGGPEKFLPLSSPFKPLYS